jgi:putative oxidoreductase
MFRKLIATADDYGPTVARLVLGAVMLPHGLQKTLGWFGGYGFGATMSHFTGQAHLPWAVAFLDILIESLGSLMLLAGLLGRVGALGVIAVMAGAIATVHGKVGFFMDWNRNQPGEGFEYHLLAIGLALVVLLKGSGALSADRALQRSAVGTDTPDDERPRTVAA